MGIIKLGVDCRYDAFHDKLLVGGHAVGLEVSELSDHACVVLRQMIEEFGFDPGRQHIFDAVVQLCLLNRFDPIVEYLESIQWDGTKRVDTWLTRYLDQKTPN
jgi:predicted P-loop ATPase